MHAFGNSILLRTIGSRLFTSNVALSENFDKFFRLELSSIVGSETFQFPTGLVFDHCKPFGEDREHPIFGSDGVSPHLPSRVESILGSDEVRSTAERLMWHRATNVRVDQIEWARFYRC